MSLLKKTFILQGQPPKGYLTALKIGATRGVKITLNSVTPNMTLAVKFGANDLEAFPIRALKEEFRVASDFDEKTDFRAVVFENESVYAYTGNAPAIAFGDWILKKPADSVSVPVDSDTQTNETRNDPETVSLKTSEPASSGPVDASKKPTEPKRPPTDVTESKTDGDAAEAKPKTDGVYFEPVLKEERKPSEAETVDAEVVTEKEDGAFRFFKKQTESRFYDRVRSRMEEMLVVHPKEESLEKLIPDSKWVRVPYAQDEFYVVGVLTDSGKVTHIGYGVKGLRSVFPPKEAEALSEFLPTEGDQGYWLMFQDAETGEMLPVD